MAAVLLIYLTAVVVCFVAGVAAAALISPAGRWVSAATVPLGAATIITLAFPFGYLLTAPAVTVVIALVVIAALIAGVALRRRTARAGGVVESRRPGGGDIAALVLGAATGLLLLAPLFSLGFPTTVAISIADGWARSVFVEWVLENPLRDSGVSVGATLPLGTYSTLTPELGAGFEYLAAVVATVLGRRGYEVVLPVAAVAGPIALGGWTTLLQQLVTRRPTVTQVTALAVATASPLFVLTFADNYITQFFSLALWPFAMAAALAFFRGMDLRAALVAGLGLAAVAGTYPPLLPWVVPVVVLLALVTPGRDPGRVALDRATLVATARRAVRRLGVLAVVVAVIAPLALVRAYEAVTNVAGLRSNAGFPLFQTEHDVALALGGVTQFSLAPFGVDPTPARLVISLVLLLAAAAVGVLAALRAERSARASILALGAGVAAVTLALYWSYKQRDFYGYGAYKTLLSGGTLLAGLLVTVLVLLRRSLWPLGAAMVAICLALWLPLSTDLLERQRDGGQGFRAEDRALGQVLDDLPDDRVVLVEGAIESTDSFRLRMTAGYFLAAASDQPDEGLGSTYTYFAGGGGESWRPNRPWSHVLRLNRPSPFDGGRKPVWREGPFLLAAAPPLDVTPYAVSKPATDATDVEEGSWALVDPLAPERLVTGPVELVVSNRDPTPRTVRLAVEVSSPDGARDVSVAAERRGGTTVRVGPKRRRVIELELDVDARSTALVGLRARRAAGGADAPAPVTVHAVRVAPAAASSAS